jgi:DNA-binding SARP family transcriptional activator
MSLRVQLFGPLRATWDGEPLPALRRERVQSLWAYLLLRHQRCPAPREHLAFTFWPDVSEDQARSKLRHDLSDLRKWLGRERADAALLADDYEVGVKPQADIWVDVWAFESGVTQGDGQLEAAVHLVTADLLPHLYDDWLLIERERLWHLYRQALSELALRCQVRGDGQVAVRWGRRLVEQDPLDEEGHQLLMVLFYANGNRVGALQQYEQYRRVLQTELGVEPTAETLALRDVIIQGEPLSAETPGLPSVVKRLVSTAAIRSQDTPADISPGGNRQATTPPDSENEQPVVAVPSMPPAAEHSYEVRVPISRTRLFVHSRASDEVSRRATRAMSAYAFFRWESAATIALVMLLVAFLPRPSPWWQPWYWIVLGALAEAILVYSSFTDPKVGARVVANMLRDTLDPRRLRDRANQSRVEKAFQYRAQIEAALRSQRAGVMSEHLQQTARGVDAWITNIYWLAERLDRYQNDGIIAEDMKAVPQSIQSLSARLNTEDDATVRAQIEATLRDKQAQLNSLRNLERLMARADTQLEGTLAALGTVYAQIQYVGAKEIDSGQAQRLRQGIADRVAGLQDLVQSVDDIYRPLAARAGGL